MMDVVERIFKSIRKEYVNYLRSLEVNEQNEKFVEIMELKDMYMTMAVVCWLIRRKSRVRMPGQALKRNTKKNISMAISSQQVSGKNSESK